jgi:hypothetical protein
MSERDLRDPRLDQAYRELPGEEPPSEVDERIRAAARRAVGAGPQSLAARERSWASRWRVPLSLAASVVVVVTLTLMMQEEEQQRARDVAPALAPAPVAPPTLDERAAPSRAPEDAKRPDTEPARRAPASAPPQRAPAADAAAPPPPQLEKLETRQQLLEAPKAAGVPPPPTTAPAVKGLASQPAAASPAAPSGVSDSLSRERAVGDRPAREMRSAPQVARSAEEWIEEIRRLKAQGRDADAAAELAEFRRRHPEYPLPVDLAR